MRSRYAVWLNDVSLESIDPGGIYVSDIAYEAAAPDWETERYMRRDGQYSFGRSIESSTVRISFAVRQYSTEKRQETVQEIIRWAWNGGWLQTSDRPGKRLRVRCKQAPAVTSVLQWTESLEITFVAYDNPFWQDIVPQKAEAAYGTDGTLYNPGVVPAHAEAIVTAASSVTGFTVTCGSTSIQLTNISLSANDTVAIRYGGEHDLLEIVKGTTSLLDKRTPDSADDLTAEPGNNTVSCSSGVTCEFSVRGWWL